MLRNLLLCATLLLLVMAVAPVLADPIIGGCQIFPLDNAWNTDISAALVHPDSAAYIANINSNGGTTLHADFGSDPTYGIPYTTVTGTQAKRSVIFDYADESDVGPYPIPPNPPIESGSDHHILIIETTNCILYELYDASYVSSQWYAGSGAIFNLGSNALRPDGWTSADAAGLPILPGLARCDEANSGTITHALRFTVDSTQRAYIYPATHFASSITDTSYPPMGLRLRLKADYDLSGLTGQALAVAHALQTYGMILADNGSNWFISGENNPDCWNDDQLNALKDIPGTAFDVIVSPQPPSEVRVPTRNAFDTATPTLTWSRIAWAVQYQIQISNQSQFPSGNATLGDTVEANALSYTALSPLANGVYYWRVRALDTTGTPSAWSAVETFSIQA
jgi:hypothetical protein